MLVCDAMAHMQHITRSHVVLDVLQERNQGRCRVMQRGCRRRARASQEGLLTRPQMHHMICRTGHAPAPRPLSAPPPSSAPPPLSAPPSLATWLFLCVNAFLRVVGLLTRYLMHPMVCKARCALIRSVFCANIDVPFDTSRVSTALVTC